MPARRGFDEANMQAAVDAVLDGLSYVRAGLEFDVSPSTVRARVVTRGLVRRRLPRREPLVPEAVTRSALLAVATGWRVEDAAGAAGIGVSTLRRRIREHGVVMVRDRKRRCSALSPEDREEIRVGIMAGEADAAIGVRIGRHRSVVWREVRANGGRQRYRAHLAEARAAEAAGRPRRRWFEERRWLWDHVVTLMREETWSPEAIAIRLKKAHPNEQEWWVSHEAIYQAVYLQARGELRKELLACLRSGRVRRKPQSRSARSGSKIVGMVNISERPPEATDRAVPGHWEGDLVIGAGGASAVATLVERTSRYGMLIKVETKNAEHVAARLAEHVTTLPAHLVRSLTWDQGTELAAHERFRVATGVPVFFCDPHAPWQRPSNENWNGHARYFLPKGTDLSVHSQEDLDTYARKINGRPRGVLGWKTAAEVFDELVALTD